MWSYTNTAISVVDASWFVGSLKGFSLILSGLMSGSIQVHLQVSKNGGLRMCALQCMMVHDIFSEYRMDFGRELNSGLDSCA